MATINGAAHTDVKPDASTYDGFISYSHAADDLLAPRLQSGLQRFAKPWWRRRALRVFRDESSLSANPDLWSSITAAMDGSDWFVLLLSEEAAQSEWVNREVEYWVGHKDPSRILPVVTDGEFAWADGDISVSSTVAPPALSGVFGEEPRWVDLRWARSDEQLDLGNARFRDAIADLASAMRGVPKDELESEEVGQHRRTIRTAWAAGVVVLLLGLAATVGAIVAVDQRDEAQRLAEIATDNEQRALTAEEDALEQAGIASQNERRALDAESDARVQADIAKDERDTAREERDRADEQASIARSRELAAAAAAQIDRDPELSLLLSLEALRGADPTIESVAALHEATLAHRALWSVPSLQGVFGGSVGAISPDGTVVVQAAGNRVTLHEADDGTELWTTELHPALENLQSFFTPSGDRVVATFAWEPERGTDEPVLPPDGVHEGIYALDVATGAAEAIAADIDWPCPLWMIAAENGNRVDLESHIFALAAVHGEPSDLLPRPDGCDTLAEFEFIRFDPISGSAAAVHKPDGGRFNGPQAISSALGRLLAVATTTRTYVYDTVEDRELISIDAEVPHLARLDESGRYLLEGGGFGHPAVIWDVEVGTVVREFSGHEGNYVWDGLFRGAAEGLITSATDGTVRSWDTFTGRDLLVLRGPADTVWAVGVSDDGDRIVSFTSEAVGGWNGGAMGELGAFDIASGGNAASLETANDLAILVGGSGRTGTVLRLEIEGQVASELIPDVTGQEGALSPDGARYAVQHAPDAVTASTIRIHDTSTGGVVVEMEGLCEWDVRQSVSECEVPPSAPFADWFFNLEFSPDGRMLAAGSQKTSGSASVWDAETGAILFNTGVLGASNERPLVSVEWLGRGDRLLVAADEELIVYDATTWTEQLRVPVSFRVNHLDFSKSRGRVLAVTQQEALVMLDSDGLAVLAETPTPHDGRVKDLSVRSDGRVVATAGSDGVVRIWDIAGDEFRPTQIIPFGDGIQNVAFVSASHLLVVPFNGPAVIVTIDSAELVGIAESRLTRSFTEAECAAYRIDPCPSLEELRGG